MMCVFSEIRRRKAMSGNWKANVGAATLEQISLTDRQAILYSKVHSYVTFCTAMMVLDSANAVVQQLRASVPASYYQL